MQSKAKNVDEYLAEVPVGRQPALERLRALFLDVLDGYEESMDYGMPSYKVPGGEIEMAFASQKNHISLYVLKQPVFDANREHFAGLSLGKGCIRYRKPEQIDFDLVRKLLRESVESDCEIC